MNIETSTMMSTVKMSTLSDKYKVRKEHNTTYLTINKEDCKKKQEEKRGLDESMHCMQIEELKDSSNKKEQNGNYICTYTSDELTFEPRFHMISKVPINIMPPPLHNINNNNNVNIQNLNRNDCWKSCSELRSSSPFGSESDDSCRSRCSPFEENSFQKKAFKNRCPTFYNQSLLLNKVSNSSGNIYCPSIQHSMNTSINKKWYHNGWSKREKRNQPQDINRRVFGLMERFTSRSKLMQINPNPPRLLTGSSWDQLNKTIWDIFTMKAQKEQTYIHKLELWKKVYIQIRKILIKYGLFMVGSTMSGLGTEHSDIDMCLLVKPCLNDPRTDALAYLQNIQNILVNCDFVKQPEVILAKVPILKFRDSQFGFEVDLNCNNAVGIRNTHLLHCYSRLDWRVRPLVIIVKLWAQANNINDAKNMTISSYSLALMVIHFLQCGVKPPALPCLHGLYPEKFNSYTEIHDIDIQEELSSFESDNTQTIGELLLGFLHYYTEFNYDRFAISVREGTVLLKEECRYTKAAKNDSTQWKLLCIEEPFDFTNTARSVYDVDRFEYIKNVFHYSYNVLRETKCLRSILYITDDNQR